MEALHFKTCPKCGHPRQSGETGDPGICPACGLIFAKWVTRDSFVPPSRRDKTEPDDGPLDDLTDALLQTPATATPGDLYGRAAGWLLIALWGLRIATLDYKSDEVMNSFLHNTVILPHEAGHIFFRILGEFMGVLGGSLFQVLLPLIVAAVLLRQNRDGFGAGLGLWWAGASLVDLSSYIYDAADPVLPLIGGGTGADRFHDWIYLLDTVNQTHRSPFWGTLVHVLGILVMIAGLAWSALVLRRQWRQRNDARPLPPGLMD